MSYVVVCKLQPAHSTDIKVSALGVTRHAESIKLRIHLRFDYLLYISLVFETLQWQNKNILPVIFRIHQIKSKCVQKRSKVNNGDF